LLRAVLVYHRNELEKFDPNVDWDRKPNFGKANPSTTAAFSARTAIDHSTKTIEALLPAIDNLRAELDRIGELT
jgi:hypothetical protein